MEVSTSSQVYQTLCCDQNPNSAKVYGRIRPSIFLDANSTDGRLEVFAPALVEGEGTGLEPSSPEDREVDASFKSLQSREDVQNYLLEAGLQMFFIRQQDSYSSLSICHDLFEFLMSERQVSPQFKDYVLYMGARDREVEVAPPRLRWRPVPANASGGHLKEYECMYGLRFVELNGRGSPARPTSKWSLRQSAIYCRTQSNGDGSTWIFVTPSKLAQQRLNNYRQSCSDNSLPKAFEIHLILLDSSISNWRAYLLDLTTEIEQHASQLYGVSPDNKGPISLANSGDRRALMALEEKLLNAWLVVTSTVESTKAHLQCYKSTREVQGNINVSIEDLTCLMFRDQLEELETIGTRIDALRSRLQSISNLVASFLDLSSGFALQNLAEESRRENENMRKLSERMHDLTKKSTRDAASVKVLTILTLVYLPTTVVSNFFSMSFVGSASTTAGSHHIVISSDWWIFVVTSIPLTLFTLYIWWIFKDIQADGTYPWWWIFRRRTSNGKEGSLASGADDA